MLEHQLHDENYPWCHFSMDVNLLLHEAIFLATSNVKMTKALWDKLRNIILHAVMYLANYAEKVEGYATSHAPSNAIFLL